MNARHRFTSVCPNLLRQNGNGFCPVTTLVHQFFFFYTKWKSFHGKFLRTWKSSGVFTASESWTWIFLTRQLMIPPVEKLRTRYCFVCYSRKNVMLSVFSPAFAINFIIFVNFVTNLLESVFIAR